MKLQLHLRRRVREWLADDEQMRTSVVDVGAATNRVRDWLWSMKGHLSAAISMRSCWFTSKAVRNTDLRSSGIPGTACMEPNGKLREMRDRNNIEKPTMCRQNFSANAFSPQATLCQRVHERSGNLIVGTGEDAELYKVTVRIGMVRQKRKEKRERSGDEPYEGFHSLRVPKELSSGGRRHLSSQNGVPKSEASDTISEVGKVVMIGGFRGPHVDL